MCDISGYDVSYDTRMIKMRKNMVTVRLLAAVKEKKKFAKHRSPKKASKF